MPAYGRVVLNSRLTHEIEGKTYVTVVEPMFARVDLQRFTEHEWETHLREKAYVLKGYMEQLVGKGNTVQLILVCEDVEDFRKISTIICSIFPEQMMPHIFYTAEGAVKSAAYDLKNSLIRVTGVKETEPGVRSLSTVTSQLGYDFF